MLSWLGVLKDPERRAILSWLGAGAMAAAGVIGAVVTFVVDHKAHDDKGVTNVYILDENAAKTVVARLISERQTPALPGTQLAVAEAVDATAKGAAAGSPRARQTLELLTAGKIVEAVPLFQAEAAEKEAASRSSAKEVAAAYRNLGAIAGLADPKRALEAYEKAVETRPDDRGIPLLAGLAQSIGWPVHSSGSQIGPVAEISFSSWRPTWNLPCKPSTWELAKERGNLSTLGLEYEEKAKKIAIEQAAANAGNLEWQRDLSVSYNKVSYMQMAQGDLAGALKSCSDQPRHHGAAGEIRSRERRSGRTISWRATRGSATCKWRRATLPAR